MPSFKRRYANTRRRLFYNERLNTFRCVVEHAFGSLKNLWRRLFYIKASIRKAVRIIASCFVLHNFIIVNEQRVPRYRNDGPRFPQERLDEFDDDHFDHACGAEKRDEIIDLMIP